jgi:transcriptional regulator with XRE-family HTH domain
MINFNADFLEMFLGVVRKYMQLRGGLSQKDLAEKTNVGISTMSRFLNQKTNQLDAQMIANIVAKLNIPLHEMIDFVAEDSTEMFKRMVMLYKEEQAADTPLSSVAKDIAPEDEIDSFEKTLDDSSTRLKTTATIRGVQVPFGERRSDERRGQKTTGEKLAELTARQKSFLSDFLNLDMDGKDLVVGTGEVIIKYLNGKQLEF